ncbi:AI-2E family transporter [Candidatus Pacearchaeota archaeon]|nr:AI-2E family transporter [Candidatus Pacearchaeota archaeon]
MEANYLRKISSLAILILLIVLSFFLLKPILLSIIFGILLAFIFSPIYDKFYNWTDMKNFSAFFMCLILIVLILIPFWFVTPILIDQSIKIYLTTQQMDFVSPLQTAFPSIFASPEFSAQIGAVIYSFVNDLGNYFVNAISNLIVNFPTLFLQTIVVFFIFFFVLRDKRGLINYLESISPFSKKIENELLKSSKGITISVLYGQVIVGIAQGIIAGIGFFLFGVSNAALLSILAVIAGIFPIIGTTIIWVPVAIYLLIAGNTFSAIGVMLFGILASSTDNFIRPLIVSRRTNLHSSIVLIGMVGGIFLFGIMGVILGPLILAYLLIILETFREKKQPSVFLPGTEKSK